MSRPTLKRKPVPWNPDLDGILRVGINRGDSFYKIASDIRARFGYPVTRSACISRSHRILREDRTITDADIDALRAAFDEGQSSRAAAHSVQCPAAVAAHYFDRFRHGYREHKPQRPQRFDPAAHRAARFYHSNFEL